MIDLNALSIFARVAEMLSFSEAARGLGMPISTVSRKVAQLEDELGVRLLERSTRRLRLTEIGAEVLSEAQRTAEVDEAVGAIVSSRLTGIKGSISLSAPPSIADIVRLSREKVPEDDIIRLLHESGAVYRLSGSELAKLKDDGVGPKVLDYLNQAQINQARYEEWARSREPILWYGPAFGFHYYYGRPWGPPWPHRRLR